MEYSTQQPEYSLDLGTFDLSDYVHGSASHELGDIFNGTNPGHPGDGASDQPDSAVQMQQQQHLQPPPPNYSTGPPPHQQQSSSAAESSNASGQLSSVQHLMSHASPSDLGITPAMLKERLEQHIKLQQIQQLQTQLLQQQIDVMLRATQGIPRTVAYQGLPTPAPSSELPPTTQAELMSMSPMFLHEMFASSAGGSQTGSTGTDPMLLPSMMQNPTMSAPAALAFQTSPPVADYELSPLWLPAGSTLPARRAAQVQQHQQVGPSTSVKRARRNSDVEDARARKRPPTAIGPSPMKRRTRSPIEAQTQVQTQMLPPPPKDVAASSASSVTSVDTPAGPHAASVSPDIAPVTPGAIMGLGPLRSGLVPPQPAVDDRRVTRKKTRTTPAPTPVGKPKAILPTGGTPILPPTTPTTAGHPPLQVRKSSHKVAEQKRRDSLKISFDDLRLLLPPIPTTLGEGEDGEVLLPGAMPPRGPPRGEGDGPNRGVSKLALLRCGNDYIRELKWKLDRRNDEIGSLRGEVARLRSAFAALGVDDPGPEDGVPIDLARDLDSEYEEVRKANKAARLAVRRALGDIDDEEEEE